MALNDIKVPKENAQGTFDETVLTPLQIGAQSKFAIESLTLTTSDRRDLTAARAKIFETFQLNGGTVAVRLPESNTIEGDIFVFKWMGGSGTVSIQDSYGAFAELATLTQGQQKRFIKAPTGESGWSLVPVDTHTHSAEVSDSAFRVIGSTDATKKVAIEVDTNVPANTTVTLTAPSASGTLALAGAAPAAHASSHHTGGTDAIAPSDIGAQSLFVTDGVVITADQTLTSGRAKIFSLQNYGGGPFNVTLPISNNLVGDIAVVRMAGTFLSDVVIRQQLHDGTQGGPQYTTMATLVGGNPASDPNQQYRFVKTNSSNFGAWSPVPVDTHTHNASAITSGTLDIARIPTGTSSTTVCIGNDSRLSDSRTPTAHAASHASAGSDPLFDQDLNSTDDVAFNEVSIAAAGRLFFGDSATFEADGELYLSAPNGILAKDSEFLITGSTATTKKLRFEADTNIPADTTVVLTSPASSGTIALSGDAPSAHAASHASAGSDPLFDQDLNTTDNPTFVDVYVGSLTADGLSQNPPTADSCSVTPQGFEFIGTAAATTRTNLGLGDAATADIGTAAGEVCAGDDARLSDSRTPTAHAASHASSGSDPLYDQDLNTTDAPDFASVTATDGADSVTVGPFSITSTFGTSIAFDESAFKSPNGTSIFAFGNNDRLDLLVPLAVDAAPFPSTVASTTRTNLGLAIGTDIAAASHTHGNLTSDGKVGSTSGLPLVTTTAGAVTTLALGTANQVLRVNSGATGVEFADPAASGVTGAASSASDVLGVSGANITGVDANADRIVYWNNTSNKLAYGTPADAGAAAASHTHAASDVTSGTFDNARINFAAPAAIGNTTPNTGAFTSLSTAPAANTSALTTTGYSLTGSNAQSLVDLAGTWNTTGTPSAFKLNITDTASNASSLLMQLQTGGTNRLTVSKAGAITSASTVTGTEIFCGANGSISGKNGFPVLFVGTTETMAWTSNASVHLAIKSDYGFGWSSGNPTGGAVDVRMWRDAAGALALRDSTNAMESRIYGTFTSSTNYQRMTIKSVKQTLSALFGASATTTGTFIPDGAVVVGVTTRVATALTGAAGYTIGDGTDADRWGDITGTAIGTTSDNRDWTAGTIECFTAGGNITLTAKTSNFTAGAIEICVFYLAGEAD